MPRIPDNINQLLGLPRAAHPWENMRLSPERSQSNLTRSRVWCEEFAQDMMDGLRVWSCNMRVAQPRPVSGLCNRVFGSRIVRNSPGDVFLHAVGTAVAIGIGVGFVGAAFCASQPQVLAASYVVYVGYHLIADDGLLTHVQF